MADPTLWDGSAVLAPAVAGSQVARLMQTNVGASFSAATKFTSVFETLFNLLQALLDQEDAGAADREHAVMLLLAYLAATSSNDKLSAVKTVQRVHRDSLLLLDSAWDVFGVVGMPIHQPSHFQAAEWMTKVIAQRSANGFDPLTGPSTF